MRKAKRWLTSALAGSFLIAAGLPAFPTVGERPDSPPASSAKPTATLQIRVVVADPPPAQPEPAKKPAPRAAEPKEILDPPSTPPPPTPPSPLNPAMVELRDRVRRTLALCARQAFNTRDNTPNEILNFCLAFGCDTETSYEGPSATKINGIGCLCWNTPCAGYSLLQMDENRVIARIGYGLQEYPSQLLAVLAQSRVPAGYEIRVGKDRQTVADLVESEKLTCLSGSDMSQKLIGLAYYLADDVAWKNRIGESWSLERILSEELDRVTSQADCDAINRLMGISYAVRRPFARKTLLEGQFARGQKHLAECQDFALKLQNPDGSWHPYFLALQGTSRDVAGTLRSTGYIFEWLAFSLPDGRLEEPGIVRSVAYLASLLENRQASVNIPSLAPRDIAAVMHAAHALAVYDDRVFRPRDAQQPAATAPKANAEPKTPDQAPATE